MAGLRVRKRVEGWALDISEIDGDPGGLTLRQRLAENNKLWILILALVLMTTLALVRNARKEGQVGDKYVIEVGSAGKGFYDDAAHKEFARGFATSKSVGVSILDARFLGPDKFRMTMPGNVSADDIDYAAKMAALNILKKFDKRIVVNVYMKISQSGAETLVATASWAPKKYGFVVKFHNSEALML